MQSIIRLSDCCSMTFDEPDPIMLKELEPGTNIFLIGPMGCGKTTVGKALAEKLNYRLVDTDEICEKMAGMPVRKIFSTLGEAHFRQLESAALQQAGAGKNRVIATGGGILTTTQNKSYLKTQPQVVFLDATVSTQTQRTRQSQSRPLLENNNRSAVLAKLYNERKSSYREVSNWTIQTDKLTPQQTVDKIISCIHS